MLEHVHTIYEYYDLYARTTWAKKTPSSGSLHCMGGMNQGCLGAATGCGPAETAAARAGAAGRAGCCVAPPARAGCCVAATRDEEEEERGLSGRRESG
jgi:hypothetical protein